MQKYKYKEGIKKFKGKNVEELNDLCIASLLAWGYIKEVIEVTTVLESKGDTKVESKGETIVESKDKTMVEHVFEIKKVKGKK